MNSSLFSIYFFVTRHKISLSEPLQSRGHPGRGRSRATLLRAKFDSLRIADLPRYTASDRPHSEARIPLVWIAFKRIIHFASKSIPYGKLFPPCWCWEFNFLRPGMHLIPFINNVEYILVWSYTIALLSLLLSHWIYCAGLSSPSSKQFSLVSSKIVSETRQ